MTRTHAVRMVAGAVLVLIVGAGAVLAWFGGGARPDGGASTSASVTATGSMSAEAERLSYLQFNLCGNVCSSGGLGVISHLASVINDRSPFAITLNEVCENQYSRLEADLAGYHGRFDPTDVRCRNGARYGNAILVRGAAVTPVGGWDLPNPARDEPRRLFCLRADRPDPPAVVVCVTHISNEAGNIAAQVSLVADLLAPLDETAAVILGGDFNTDPTDARMDPLYRTCAGSAFREVDSAGCANRSAINHSVDGDVLNEDTFGGHKFDYIFYSAADWSAPEADAVDLDGFSDHDALWATASLMRV